MDSPSPNIAGRFVLIALVIAAVLGHVAKGSSPTNPSADIKNDPGQAPIISVPVHDPLLEHDESSSSSSSTSSSYVSSMGVKSLSSSSSSSSVMNDSSSIQQQDLPAAYFADQCFYDSCHSPGGPATCRCDDMCLFFGDCCDDFEVSNDTDANRTEDGSFINDVVNMDVWQCVNDSFLPQLHPLLRHGYQMVVRCPQDWPSDHVRHECESMASEVRHYLYVAGETYYTSSHCAICNGVDQSSLSVIEGLDVCTWLNDTWLECASFVEAPFNATSLGNATLTLPPDVLNETIHEVPKPRLCLQDIVEHCENETDFSEDVRNCRHKYAPVIYNGVVTKHASCAKCNSNVELMCPIIKWTLDPVIIDSWILETPVIGIPLVFQQIVNSQFGTSSECVEGLQLNEYGQCVPVTTTWPKCEAVRTSLEQKGGSFYCLQDTFCSYERYQDGVHVSVDTMPPCFESSDIVNGTFLFDLRYEPDAIPPVEAIEEVVLTTLQNKTGSWCWSMEIFVDQLCTIEPEEANGTGCNYELFTDHPSEFRPTFVYNQSMVFYNQTFIQPIWWRNETTMTIHNQSQTISEPRFELCGVTMVIQTCPTFLVANDSVEWLLQGNDSVIKHQNTIYNSDEYLIYPDGRISICFIEVDSESDAVILTIVSHVAFAISSACIFATFITYISFPVLRNRQGIVIMNFLVALFFGQVLLQYVGYQMSEWFLPCVVVAALSHFFFLASFVWTTVLAWDLSRSFSSSSMRSFATKSFGRRVVLYLLVGWGVPLTFVCVTLVLQFNNLQTVVLVEYGGPACWFTDRFASIAVFFAPISLCLFMNIILFIVTIRGVHSTKKMTAMLKEGQESSLKQQVMELRIYIKISALLGFAWISGFLAMVINIPAMWYVFVIVSGLQGVFIFISFGVNKRGRKLWHTSTGSSVIWRSLTRKDYSKGTISGSSGRNTRSGSPGNSKS